ncbi:MAG: hypothetical protein R3B48_26715 [Kofleriaceae bacterium]
MAAPAENVAELPLGEAQVTKPLSETKKPTLPPGAVYLPQEEVIRRYGKTPEEAAAKDRTMELAVGKLFYEWRGMEDLSAKGVGQNRILRLRGGQELLILSGRVWSICWGEPTVVAYDIRRRTVAVLSSTCDYDCEIPETPTKNDYHYTNESIAPKDVIFSILWAIIFEGIEVSDENNTSRSCNLADEDIPEDF